MDLSRPLPLLSLALSNAAKGPMSRYSLMTQINQICSKIEGPYSPGAVYHCIKQLREAKMIEFNHSTPEVTPLGLESPPAPILDLYSVPNFSDSAFTRIRQQRKSKGAP